MENTFVLALVSDLFFVVKIEGAAKLAGMTVRFVSDPAHALERANEGPAIVLVDLNNEGSQPIEFVRKLKVAEATRSIPVLGYLSHVQVELKKKAEEAGCDRVLARSVVSEKLGEILRELRAG